MTRYQLTIEVETVEQLRELVRLVGAMPSGMVRQVEAGNPPACPNGHGAMILIPGGTVSSGPRIGQAYPPFYRCAQKCGAKAELSDVAA
jgi:hypothetical protein